MRNIKQRKFKKIIATVGLSTFLALTGCGKSNVEEPKVVETTENVDNNEAIEQEITAFYDEYLGFFEGKEDKNYSLETVRNLKILLNTDNKDDLRNLLSYEDILEAEQALEDIYCPFDLLEEMNTNDLIEDNGLNYNDVEHTEIEVYPKLSKLITDDDSTKTVLNEIEEIRDSLANSVRNNTLNEDIASINASLVDRYHDAIPGDKSGVADTERVGKNLALAFANYGVLKLGKAANPEKRTPGGWIYNDKLDIGNGQKQGIKVNEADAGERVIVTAYEAIKYFNDVNAEGLVGQDAIDAVVIYTGLDEEKVKELINLSNEEQLSLQQAYYNIIETMPVYFYDPCDEEAIITNIYNADTLTK